MNVKNLKNVDRPEIEEINVNRFFWNTNAVSILLKKLQFSIVEKFRNY